MPCLDPFYPFRQKRYAKDHPRRDIAVPCSRCVVCKSNRVRGWIFRMKEEEKNSSSSYFVTLTYDTKYVPLTTGKYPMTLRKRDLQKFFKRLRKNDKNNSIRYFAAGEYGDQRYRPHYHAIIFNVKDVQSIADSWTLGIVDIGSCTGNSIAYTIKYIDKEKKIPIGLWDKREREFQLQSKGLGKSYITEKIRRYHKADLNRNYVMDGFRKVPMPRYYRDKIFEQWEKDKQIEIILDSEIKRKEKLYKYYIDKKYNRIEGYTFDRFIHSVNEQLEKRFYKKLKSRDL